MTIGLAWVGRKPDGREHLYLASDSRVTGGFRLDACPKILTLPRSDCAMCFAGDTGATYPLMIQVSHAIAAHQPARERSMDISKLLHHLLRVFSDFVQRLEEPAYVLRKADVQFLFGGYSWRRKGFRLWTIYYVEKERRFAAREAVTFHERLSKAAFIGDWSRPFRAALYRELNACDTPAYLEPLKVLAGFIQNASVSDTIGGPPQLVRVTEHMNTRAFCVKWHGEDTLFGRPLFDYENTDFWTVDPYSGRFQMPRKFGHRTACVDSKVDGEAVDNQLRDV